MYILKVYSIDYKLRQNPNVKKMSFGQNKRYKKWALFFRELQLVIDLLLIHNSYNNWNTWFSSLKLCVGLFIIDSVSDLLNFIFCLAKIMNSLILKRHNSFQNKNDRKATYSFAPRPVIFKLGQEVSKFNNICLSWSSPNTDLWTNFLNL